MSPEGEERALMERSNMNYLDQSTFSAVRKDAWKRCKALDGMDYLQLEAALTSRSMPHAAISVDMADKSRFPAWICLESDL